MQTQQPRANGAQRSECGRLKRAWSKSAEEDREIRRRMARELRSDVKFAIRQLNSAGRSHVRGR